MGSHYSKNVRANSEVVAKNFEVTSIEKKKPSLFSVWASQRQVTVSISINSQAIVGKAQAPEKSGIIYGDESHYYGKCDNFKVVFETLDVDQVSQWEENVTVNCYFEFDWDDTDKFGNEHTEFIAVGTYKTELSPGMRKNVKFLFNGQEVEEKLKQGK